MFRPTCSGDVLRTARLGAEQRETRQDQHANAQRQLRSLECSERWCASMFCEALAGVSLRAAPGVTKAFASTSVAMLNKSDTRRRHKAKLSPCSQARVRRHLYMSGVRAEDRKENWNMSLPATKDVKRHSTCKDSELQHKRRRIGLTAHRHT